MGPMLLVLLAATLSTAQELQPAPLCPARCLCRQWLGLLAAFCTGQNLYSVYTGVPNVVQALDLFNNSINKLEDWQLSRAGLTRLKYLNLSMNAINEIGPYAFQDLKNLTVLDLSMNHLDFIATDTFYYNQNLRILNLARNKFNLRVPELHSTSIMELNLSGCQINDLYKSAFAGLKQLRKLDLSNNMLFDLDKDVLRPILRLDIIMLSRNKFMCEGPSIDSLKLHLRNRNIRTDSFCEKSKLPTREKFEKIIALKPMSTEDEPKLPPRRPPPEAPSKNPWDIDSWKELEQAVGNDLNDSDSNSSSIFANALNNVSPLWFLLVGFLLGSGATIVITYLWLSTTISCLIPRIRRAEAADSADASSQRVSLLRHLWQQDSMANSEDGTPSVGNNNNQTSGGSNASVPSCPGTPPPPYREVMLHRNLYPRAAMHAAAAAAATSPITYTV